MLKRPICQDTPQAACKHVDSTWCNCWHSLTASVHTNCSGSDMLQVFFFLSVAHFVVSLRFHRLRPFLDDNSSWRHCCWLIARLWEIAWRCHHISRHLISLSVTPVPPCTSPTSAPAMFSRVTLAGSREGPRCCNAWRTHGFSA